MIAAQLQKEIKYDKQLTKREEILLMKKINACIANKCGILHILKQGDFSFDNLLEPDFCYHEVSIFSMIQVPAIEEQWLKQCAVITYSHIFCYHGKYYLQLRMRCKK